jgi:hypothetical protein
MSTRTFCIIFRLVSKRCVSVRCRQVLGAVCVGVVGYYGYQYYDDTGVQAAEWVTLVFDKLADRKHEDLAKPVMLFLIAASACLINTLCLLIACSLSPITALMINRTAYVSLTSINTRVMTMRSCLK